MTKTAEEIDYNVMFGRRLRAARALAGMTQYETSKAANITRNNIPRYETGEILPGSRRLFLICKTLNVSADYLLGLTDGKP